MLCRSDRRPRLPARAGLSCGGRIGTMFWPTWSGGIASGSTGEGSGAALNGVARLMPARAVSKLSGFYGVLVSCRAWLGTHTLEPVRPDPLLRGRPRILVDRRAARRRPLASLQRAPFAAGARRRSRSKLVTAGAGGAECARSASTRSPGTFGCWLRAPLNDADALLRLLC